MLMLQRRTVLPSKVFEAEFPQIGHAIATQHGARQALGFLDKKENVRDSGGQNFTKRQLPVDAARPDQQEDAQPA